MRHWIYYVIFSFVEHVILTYKMVISGVARRRTPLTHTRQSALFNAMCERMRDACDAPIDQQSSLKKHHIQIEAIEKNHKGDTDTKNMYSAYACTHRNVRVARVLLSDGCVRRCTEIITKYRSMSSFSFFSQIWFSMVRACAHIYIIDQNQCGV